MVSEARTIPRSGERGRVEPSRECLLDHAAPGSSTETASFTIAGFQRKKCMEENSLMLQCQRTNFRDASTCADPGFAGTRAPLSMTSLKYFGKLRHSSPLQ